MRIYKVEKDITQSDATLILHQVNCQHTMGSGVAKAIKTKWPRVYHDYMSIEEQKLGMIQTVKVETNKYVVNMFAQDKYGYDGKRYTSYDALDKCLQQVAEFCRNEMIDYIAIPYNMSCDRGGASWNVVLSLIENAFKDNFINIEICEYKK
jgi:O-acetyl-ADP-ribose deacetylase (regulator of RNase III)